MVNRKAVVIAASAVAVLIAAAVVLSVIFTIVLPNNGEADVPAFDMEAPNPGMKRTESYGEAVSSGANFTWLMTYEEDTDMASVKNEMETAGMPWEIKDIDNSQKMMAMTCPEDLLPAALKMKSNAQKGKYIEKMMVFRANQTSVWGIDRIDQRGKVGNPAGGFTPGTINGAGVDVHILDTGVNAAHVIFGGRVKAGYDAYPNDGVPPTQDCQGHGTHVAGTVAGNTYGIARGADIYGSQVLSCDGSGSTQGIVAAINWVANVATTRKKVINMSLGGGASTLLDQAVANAVAKGVTVVVAAGNENQNACNVSPARAPSAITVVASDRNDARASFSNYGTCTDIVAPGVQIISASHQSTTGTATMSGTSMAAPHVAGVAALVRQAFPNFTPQQVADYLISTGTKDITTGLPAGTPNVMLYWNTQTTGTQTTATTTTQTTATTTTTRTTSPTPTPTQPSDGSITVQLQLNARQAITVPAQAYTSANAGQHKATLVGAPGTDFDLYLWRYTSRGWALAASSATPSATETVTYNSVDRGQTFIWQVVSFSGSGAATLTYSKPN